MDRTSQTPRIAIVHDWLTNMGGAEEVVLALAEAFPGAPIYTSTYDAEKMPRFATLDVRTTYLQHLPRALANAHKLLPMLRVRAFKHLDLSEFDVIISSSSAEAKQVQKPALARCTSVIAIHPSVITGATMPSTKRPRAWQNKSAC